jgi:hypothetical protein
MSSKRALINSVRIQWWVRGWWLPWLLLLPLMLLLLPLLLLLLLGSHNTSSSISLVPY